MTKRSVNSNKSNNSYSNNGSIISLRNRNKLNESSVLLLSKVNVNMKRKT